MRYDPSSELRLDNFIITYHYIFYHELLLLSIKRKDNQRKIIMCWGNLNLRVYLWIEVEYLVLLENMEDI